MSTRSRSIMVPAGMAIAVLFVAAGAAAATHHGGRRQRPIEGRLHIGRDEIASTNWSGFAARQFTFESVRGSWVQPTANCALKKRQVALAAFWVGLDGYESNTVEQIGTDADCEGSEEIPLAWYEFYPERLFVIPHNVEAGDRLHAEVTQSRLFLEDETEGWQFEKAYSPGNLEFSSAEWIAEAPYRRFTDFGEVDFTEAFASAEGNERSVEGWEPNLDKVVLVNHAGPRGTTLAEPEALSGSSFSIVQP